MELLAKLGINWQLLIAQIVNFAIVAGVLTYLVYKPLLDLIDRRSERIRKALEEAKRLEGEAEKMEGHRREQLKKIDEEAGVMLAEARKKAEAMHGQMLDKARIEAAAIVEKGKQELAQERRQALDDVQNTLAKAVVTLSEKLLEREFSDADQKKIMASVNDSIPSLLK